MSDTTDPALAIGAIVSIVSFCAAGIGVCLWKDGCQKRRKMKVSKSDSDLESMVTQELSGVQYASPPVLVSTTSLHKVSSFE